MRQCIYSLTNSPNKVFFSKKVPGIFRACFLSVASKQGGGYRKKGEAVEGRGRKQFFAAMGRSIRTGGKVSGY